MWLALALLACADAPPNPAPEDPPVAPAPEPPPIGAIGGEPILSMPTVIGALGTDAVTAGIAARMADIERCYTTAREKNPDLAGKVLVRFVIVEDGTVQRASIHSTSLRDEATEKCVLGQVAMATFPPLPPGGTAVVQYTFVFPSP